MGVTYAVWDDVVKVAPIALPDSIRPRVEEYIVQASVRLRAHPQVLGLDRRLADGEIEADTVKGIVVDAALRLAYNPTGAQSQSAGPFNLSKAGGVASDHIVFSDDQIALLAPVGAVPGTFGVATALIPGVPALRAFPGTVIPASVEAVESLKALAGYPYAADAVWALWEAYGPPDWYGG